jgi:transglutaminase-like putative cysteine protease
VLATCVGELRAAPSIGIKPVPSWVVPVTPGGKAAGAKDFSGGYYTSFLDKQVNLGAQSSYHRFVRQIVSESGIQNGSEVSIRINPAYERIDFHEVTVWRGGQRLSRLNLQDFKMLPVEEERQRFIYNGEYSATLVLKDIRKGDRIDVSYSRTGWNPVFKNKYSAYLYFDAYDYISHIHTAILAPAGRTLSFKDFNKPPVRATRNEGGNTIYEWTVNNVKNNSYDDNVPGWYNKDPFVQVTEFKSWKEVVDWGLNFYQVPAPTGALKKKVDEWKAESTTRLEFIGKAIRFVQDEIRYLGVETGENSHKPHTPEEVFAQRYGDCKDKAFLLCAILRSNGIECDPVLVDTYKRSHLSDYLPSPSDFNHVIARVKMVEKPTKDEDVYTFVDATISLQGGIASQMLCPPYGKGLILANGQSAPTEIRRFKYGTVDIVEDIYLPTTGDTVAQGRLEVKTVYHDAEADDFRTEFQESDISQLEEDYLNFYKDVFKYSEVDFADTLEYYDHREGNNFSLIERYSLKNPWQLDSTRSKYFFDIFGKTLYGELTFLPGRPRKDPLYLKFPFDRRYTINLHLPSTFSITRDKWEIKREAYIIEFESKYLREQNIWRLTYHYKNLLDHLPLAQTKQFKADMDKLAGSLEYQLYAPQTGNMKPSDVNDTMIVVFLVAIVASFMSLIRLYQFSPGAGSYHEPAIHIGSWLVFIGMIMVLQPVVNSFILLGLLGDSHLLNDHWNAYESKGFWLEWYYRGFMIFQVCYNVFMVGLEILLAILFFKKRDSFPGLYIFFLGLAVVGSTFDTAVSYTLSDNPDVTIWPSVVSIIRNVIFAAIWIPYMHKSERVRRTFVNSYENNPVKETTGSAEVAEPLE